MLFRSRPFFPFSVLPLVPVATVGVRLFLALARFPLFALLRVGCRVARPFVLFLPLLSSEAFFTLIVLEPFAVAETSVLAQRREAPVFIQYFANNTSQVP